MELNRISVAPIAAKFSRNGESHLQVSRLIEETPEVAIHTGRANQSGPFPDVYIYDVDITMVISNDPNIEPRPEVGRIERVRAREPRMMPEAAELIIPSGCTSDWKKWTEWNISEWCLSFVTETRYRSYFRRAELTPKDLELICWRKEHHRYRLSKSIADSVRIHFNRVVNHHRGYTIDN